MTEHKFGNLIETDHVLIRHFLTILRRDSCKHNQFRLCLNQIYLFLTYEALRHFEINTASVDLITPARVEVTNQQFIRTGDIAIIAVVRGGMAPAATLNGIFPKAQLAHVATKGGKNGGKAEVVYDRMPEKLDDRKCLVIAPRIETGSSVLAVLEYIKKLRGDRSMSEVIVINIVCAPEGVKKLLQNFPTVKIVTASLEFGLNEDREVIPGIGRTGERVYETVDLKATNNG